MPSLAQQKILFEQCVESESDALFRVAFRLTGCRETATELVQETFMAAWKNLNSLKDSGKMRSWMFSILRNLFKKSLRNRRVEQSLLDHDAIETILTPPTGHDAETRSDHLQFAIEQLPEDQKMPLLLVTMEGLSIDDAAGILGIPRGTVLSRIHRAKRKLKSSLQRIGNNLGEPN